MEFQDQLKRRLRFRGRPERIISLVPSQTELLYYLGIKPIAQTIFCVEPKNEFKLAQKIGGTKKLHIEKIRALQPDLIIGNKEENDEFQIRTLAEEFPVWMSDIYTLQDALDMIIKIGYVIDRQIQANTLKNKIRNIFFESTSKRASALYLIWKDPYMAAGKHTFINEMMNYAGFENVLKETISRYPIVSKQDIADLDPAYILLSSEPFPFKSKHVEELKSQFPKARILLVDGTYFSWYGSRLANAVTYFKTLV